jgi:glycerol-3-phosphate acyltransferase PlsY
VEILYPVLLAVCAFWLGACPFSVWIGHLLLGKDVRNYGDGNPGAANVFRSGGHKAGSVALALDIAKGVPFIILAQTLFSLPEPLVMIVAIGPILGHAFSPLLRFKGGKSIAVTFGVLMALSPYNMLITFAIFVVLGFLFIEVDAWAVLLGPAGSLSYLVVTGASLWTVLFMVGVFVIMVIKHFGALQTIPRHKGRLFGWLESRRRET